MVNYKELVEFIVKHLVTQPDSVEIENGEEDGGSKILIRVAHEDVGRVIGKQRSTLSGCWPKRQQSRPERELMLTSSRTSH